MDIVAKGLELATAESARLRKRIVELEKELKGRNARIEYLEASLKEAGLPIYHDR